MVSAGQDESISEKDIFPPGCLFGTWWGRQTLCSALVALVNLNINILINITGRLELIQADPAIMHQINKADKEQNIFVLYIG